MLSIRLVAVLALAAVAVAAPPPELDKPSFPRPVTNITEDDIDDGPWFSFPAFGNLFAPLWRLFPTFTDFGPKIQSDSNKFQVAFNAKTYDKDDLKVDAKGGVLCIQGEHKTKDGEGVNFVSFYHTYVMPENANPDDITAQLTSDKFLVVTAPIKETSVNRTSSDSNKNRSVPITEVNVPYDGLKDPVPSEATTPAAAVPKEREPTTPPADREEVTGKADKENDIPNEINP